MMSSRKFLTAICAASALALMGTAASAATYGTIPGVGTNDSLVPLFGAGTTDRGGWYGANLYLLGDSDITVEYVGAEAGNKNTFHWDGSLFATTPGNSSWTASGASGSYPSVMAGLLDFGFGINSATASVFNGSNPDDSAGSAGPNFFVSFANEAASSGSEVYLFLDDGNQSDDNHDDMVIKLSTTGRIGISPVPLPAGGLLLLGGLAALGALRRRRKAA